MPDEGDDVRAAYALAEKELTRAKASGSILLITDALTESAEFTGTPVQVLGMVGVDGGVALQAAVDSAGAPWIPVSIDDSDISRINDGVKTSFAAMPSDEGNHWKDQGYWLLPVIAILALFWFREGWKIS